MIPIPNNSSFLLLRLLRVFRILRIISVIPELKLIIEALLGSIKRVFYVGYHLNLCILYTRNLSALQLKHNNFDVKIVYKLCDILFDSRYISNNIKTKSDAKKEMKKSIKKILE